MVEHILQIISEKITLVPKCKQWLHERDGLHKLFTGVQRKILIKKFSWKDQKEMSELNGSEKIKGSCPKQNLFIVRFTLKK